MAGKKGDVLGKNLHFHKTWKVFMLSFDVCQPSSRGSLHFEWILSDSYRPFTWLVVSSYSPINKKIFLDI